MMNQSLLPLAILLVASFSQPLMAAPFTNGDFSSFAGWEGVIRNTATDLDEDVPNLNADGHFSLLGGGFAQISNDVDYYEVTLLQSFDLDPLARTLTFDFDWSLSLTDSVFGKDFVQASLLDAFGNKLADLFPLSLDTSALAPPSGFGPAVTDISGFAGQSVIVQFLVQDGDELFDKSDWLQIGNIEITSATVPAPEPLALICLGTVVLGWVRRRTPR